MRAAGTTPDSLGLRIASAAVLIPVTVACVWVGGWLFDLLVLAVVVLLTNEWDRLCGGTGLRTVMGAMQAGTLAAVAILAALGLYPAAFGVIAIGAVALLGVSRGLNRPPLWPAAAVPYFGIPALALIWLRTETEHGAAVMLFLLAVVWALDSGAILAGRTIRGPRLAPAVSPNKTWSGLIGGLVAAAATGAVAAWLAASGAWGALIAISLVIWLISQAGDLAESAIKRHFGVKDSGLLIPGHGGILDRVDGLLFAAPALAAFAFLNNGSVFQWR